MTSVTAYRSRLPLTNAAVTIFLDIPDLRLTVTEKYKQVKYRSKKEGTADNLPVIRSSLD